MTDTMHYFNTRVAKEIGIVPAIILQNLSYWIDKNEANERHFYDGYYWTYNTVKAFNELFPYVSANTIRNALNKLEELELIKTGNYNEKGYDKTKWYTITKSAKWLLQNQQMALPKVTNGVTKSNKPIPYNKPDSKPNSKHIVDSIPYKEIIDYLNEKANRQYRNVGANKKLIRARFNEGYTLEDFKTVIDKKVNEWTNTKWEKYLQPSTLFGTKFDQYLNQQGGTNGKAKTGYEDLL